MGNYIITEKEKNNIIFCEDYIDFENNFTYRFNRWIGKVAVK